MPAFITALLLIFGQAPLDSNIEHNAKVGLDKYFEHNHQLYFEYAKTCNEYLSNDDIPAVDEMSEYCHYFADNQKTYRQVVR